MNCGLRHFGNDVMQLSYRICTSHLSGLWISAAISNTSHSNKHGWQVKDQGRWQYCHNKHKKCPYQPTRDVSLLSGHATYIHHSVSLSPSPQSVPSSSSRSLLTLPPSSLPFHNISSSVPSTALDIQHFLKPLTITSGGMHCRTSYDPHWQNTACIFLGL